MKADLIGEAAPLEVELPDGGRLVIGFADAESQALFSAQIVAAVFRHEGSERDVEAAIEAAALELGLRVAASPSRKPTVLLISRR